MPLHPKPCPCDACYEALYAELERRLLALEIACAMAGLQVPSSLSPAVVGESWRAPTVTWWEWYDYDARKRREVLELLKLFADVEAFVQERGRDA